MHYILYIYIRKKKEFEENRNNDSVRFTRLYKQNDSLAAPPPPTCSVTMSSHSVPARNVHVFKCLNEQEIHI